MVHTLNTDKLAEMVKRKRGERGLRAVAKESNVSISTLSRIEQGNVPDIDTYIKVCTWLGVPTDYFTKEEEEVKSRQQQIVAHLRAEKLLDSKTAESLITMITMAYHNLGVNGSSRTKEKK